MNSPINSQDHVHEPLPAELEPIARAVDALAAFDACAAPGLEDRIARATRGSLTRPVAAHARVDADQEPWSLAALLGRMLTPVRLAAVVALSGGAVAVWMATMTGGPAGSAVAQQDETEFHLVLAALDHSWFGEGDLDLLRLETDVVADSLSWDWPLASEGAL